MQDLASALQVRPRNEHHAPEPVVDQSQQETLSSMPNTPISQDDVEASQHEDKDNKDDDGNDAEVA